MIVRLILLPRFSLLLRCFVVVASDYIHAAPAPPPADLPSLMPKSCICFLLEQPS